MYDFDSLLDARFDTLKYQPQFDVPVEQYTYLDTSAKLHDFYGELFRTNHRKAVRAISHAIATAAGVMLSIAAKNERTRHELLLSLLAGMLQGRDFGDLMNPQTEKPIAPSAGISRPAIFDLAASPAASPDRSSK